MTSDTASARMPSRDEKRSSETRVATIVPHRSARAGCARAVTGRYRPAGGTDNASGRVPPFDAGQGVTTSVP